MKLSLLLPQRFMIDFDFFAFFFNYEIRLLIAIFALIGSDLETSNHYQIWTIRSTPLNTGASIF